MCKYLQADAAEKREEAKLKILEQMQADKKQLTQSIMAWMAVVSKMHSLWHMTNIQNFIIKCIQAK